MSHEIPPIETLSDLRTQLAAVTRERDEAQRILHDADATPLSSVAQEMAQLRDNAEATGLALNASEARCRELEYVCAAAAEDFRKTLDERTEDLRSALALSEAGAGAMRLALERYREACDGVVSGESYTCTPEKPCDPCVNNVRIDTTLSSDAGRSMLEALGMAKEALSQIKQRFDSQPGMHPWAGLAGDALAAIDALGVKP